MAPASKHEEERPAKRTKYDYFEPLIVLVGPDENKFIIPQTLVYSESKFFQCACNGNWKEAAQQTVKLAEADPHIFGVFVGWLHTGILDFSKNADDDPVEYKKVMPDEAYDTAVRNIIHSFVLGDMLQSQCFCNALVDDMIRLIQSNRHLPVGERYSGLFDSLPQGSTMRRLMVDYVAFDLSKQGFMEFVCKLQAGIFTSKMLPCYHFV